jgi:hypothetical protein
MLKTNTRHVIGISGFARSGKDTLARFLASELRNLGLNVKILSFAFPLKKDMDSFCMSKFGISAFSEDSELKAKIRPLLIAYGACQRQLTEGKYWLNKLKVEVDNFFSNNGNVVIVPDLRFKEFKFDEFDLIKSYSGNTIVTVSKTLECGKQNSAAHESELKNFPFFLKNSNLNIDWTTSNNKEYLSSKASQCLKILNLET